MYKNIIKQINNAEKILLFPHESIDGDGVGCCVAMCDAIRSMGKQCYVLYDEPTLPEYVSFWQSDAFVTEAPYVPDLSIALDCGADSRIEKRLSVFRSAKTTCCIDHHVSGDKFADFAVIDPSAASCTILVWECIKEMGTEITKRICNAVYTGLLTDTGSFKHGNTDARAHKLAAELLEYGVDHSFICNQVFCNIPLAQLDIEAAAMKNAEVFADGKAVISYCTYDYWNKVGGEYSYTETSIDVIRKIKGTEVAIFLKEKEPGMFKASLRSKEYADVRSIAVKLGGGGHKMAAACTIRASLEEVIKQLKAEAISVL